MLRKRSHHHVKTSAVCGEIIEILSSRDYPQLNIAMVINIKPTQAHYHMSVEEIYFVIDGCITLGLYDPRKDQFTEQVLEAHELMVVAPGIHHKVLAASESNRLSVISIPGFDPNDEHISNKF